MDDEIIQDSDGIIQDSDGKYTFKIPPMDNFYEILSEWQINMPDFLEGVPQRVLLQMFINKICDLADLIEQDDDSDEDDSDE